MFAVGVQLPGKVLRPGRASCRWPAPCSSRLCALPPLLWAAPHVLQSLTEEKLLLEVRMGVLSPLPRGSFGLLPFTRGFLSGQSPRGKHRPGTACVDPGSGVQGDHIALLEIPESQSPVSQEQRQSTVRPASPGASVPTAPRPLSQKSFSWQGTSDLVVSDLCQKAQSVSWGRDERVSSQLSLLGTSTRSCLLKNSAKFMGVFLPPSSFQLESPSVPSLLRCPSTPSQIQGTRRFSLSAAARALFGGAGGQPQLTLREVAELVRKKECRRVVVMAGAGISTPSGIPDFR